MKKASRFAGLMLVLALGVMAFGATAAHAETNAKWLINTTATTTALKAQVQVTELETLAATGVKEGILLTKTGLTKVEILCTAMKFVDALLTEKGGATGKIHFEGCVTKLNGGAAAGACKPHSPGHPEGLVETNALKGLIVLHEPKAGEKVDQLELTPVSGEDFVILKMGSEVKSECSIGAEFLIGGKAFLEANTVGEGLEEKVEHLFKEAPTLTKLFFGTNPATIDGSAKAKLIGTHEGMNWSGQPG